MKLHVIGTNFKHAVLEDVARVQWPEKAMISAFLAKAAAQFNIDEIFFLQTCNRREFYFHSPHPTVQEHALRDHFLTSLSHSLLVELHADHFYHLRNEAAVRHFFNVAASLDSMVLGETEIIKQIKDQSGAAQRAGHMGQRLKALVDTALWASKQVRHQTKITENVVSIGSLAFRSVASHLDRHHSRRVVFVGAGHFIRSILPTFAKAQDLDLIFVNRTLPTELAEEYGARAMTLEQFLAEPVAFEAIVTATSSTTPIFTREWVHRHGRGKLILDAALPADTDAGDLPETTTYMDLTQMEAVLVRNRAARAAEIPKAEPLFLAGWERVKARWLEFDLAEYNREISNHYQATGARALTHLIKTLEPNLSEQDEAALRDWTQNLMGKLTTIPILGLKSVARELGEPAVEAYTKGISHRANLFKAQKSS